MNVEIDLRDGFLLIYVIGDGDRRIMGRTVSPGQRWRGWKYSRLAKLGPGRHELLTRQQKEAMKDQ